MGGGGVVQGWGLPRPLPDRWTYSRNAMVIPTNIFAQALSMPSPWHTPTTTTHAASAHANRTPLLNKHLASVGLLSAQYEPLRPGCVWTHPEPLSYEQPSLLLQTETRYHKRWMQYYTEGLPNYTRYSLAMAWPSLPKE